MLKAFIRLFRRPSIAEILGDEIYAAKREVIDVCKYAEHYAARREELFARIHRLQESLEAKDVVSGQQVATDAD